MEVRSIELSTIAVDHIVNCRKDLNVDDLMESIQETGLQTPLGVCALVGGGYGLVYGFRRYEAMVNLGLESAPCRVVSGLTNADLYIMNLQENVSRQNLNPIEEAEAIQRIIDSGRTIESFRKALGWSKTLVTQRIGLLSLSDFIREALRADLISVRQAKVVDEAPQEYQGALLSLAKDGATIKTMNQELAQLMSVGSLVEQDDEGSLFLEHDDDEANIEDDGIDTDSLEDRKALAEADSNMLKASLLDCGASAIKDTQAYFAFQVAVNCVDFSRLPDGQRQALVSAINNLCGEHGLDAWGEAHKR